MKLSSLSSRAHQLMYQTLVLGAAAMPSAPASAQAVCTIRADGPIGWGACSGTQRAQSFNAGQRVTVQNTAPGFTGSLTRICGVNGTLAAISAPCRAVSATLPLPLPMPPERPSPLPWQGGDWTLGFMGQSKPVTLTVNSTGGCTSSRTFAGRAYVNRDGSITVTMPPYSGFANCTAPRPYLQNPTSCKLTSPSDGNSVFSFEPGFVVSSVPAVNDNGGGCR
ncbi:MAG: hypothetical protein IPN53_07155 [Comamonadaceae bacterium]|nr:hypothetical protein [Comamonadaceae bacterium]